MIKLELNIQELWKVKKFIGVYYEWGRDARSLYAKMNMEKDVKKLVERYEKFTGSYVKVKKTSGAPGTTLSKSEFEKPKYIDTYRSFMGILNVVHHKGGT